MKDQSHRSLLAWAAGMALLFSGRAVADDLYVSNGSAFGFNNILSFAPSGTSTVFSVNVSTPTGLAFDNGGNLYVANFSGLFANTIRRFTPGGGVSVFASSGMNGPQGLAFDQAGNLYVANHFNNTIERFTPGGVASVFASTGLSVPQGLAFDTSGNLFVSNAGTNNIVKFTPSGVGSLFANTGTYPQGLAFDHAGNLYVANRNNSNIQRFTQAGVGSIIASTNLTNVCGLAFDSAGDLYATVAATNAIRKITPAGVNALFANSGMSGPTFAAIAPVATPIVRIAGFATPMPDGTGNFTSFPNAPSISGDNVAFVGNGLSGAQGVFARIGVLVPPQRIADTATAIPGGSGGNFTAFPSSPSISGDNVAFIGNGASGAQGVYERIGVLVPPQRVADTATAIPSGSGGNFTAFPSSPSISGENVAFIGNGASGVQGVYGRIGVLVPPQRVADTATAIPSGSGGNFTAFPGSPSISGENVAFIGNGASGVQGVYERIGVLVPPQRVADTSMLMPGRTENFLSFPGSPSISGENVAFIGNGASGAQGVYERIGVQVPPQRVADTSTAIPGGAGLFLSFSDVSISETDVAFMGYGANGQQGIYDMTGGSLVKVVDLNTIIDGRSIIGLSFSRSGLWGDPIAFQATFADGSQGIYFSTVPVPEPSTMALCGFATLAFAYGRLRRAGSRRGLQS